MTLSVNQMTVTPAIAEAWLKMNPANRNMNAGLVDAYSRDMLAGKWANNGDAIRFKENGNLADGQHRLAACVKSGVSFPAVIVTGVADEDMLTIDMGRKRTLGDHLTIVGEKHANRLAATIRQLACIADNSARVKLTASESAAILAAHPLVRASAAKTYGPNAGNPALIAAVHYIGAVVHGLPDRADSMVAVLNTGVPDYDGCPFHLLRERIIRLRQSGHRMAINGLQDLAVHAWNTFAAQRPVRVLKAPENATIVGWNRNTLLGPR